MSAIENSYILVENEITELLLNIFDTSTSALPDNNCCPLCGKFYKSYRGLSAHVTSSHPGSLCLTQPPEADNADDPVCRHTKELLKMLLIKRLMDYSIRMGDGSTLALVIKHMLLYFKELGCTKYSVASFEFIAQQQIFLSERMAAAVRQDRFVNNKGRAYTNIPIDLDVEHSNKDFKENFRLSLGEPSESVLKRLSFSQDHVGKILETFRQSFNLQQYESCRTVDESRYQSDVNTVVAHLKTANVFATVPGRTLYSKQLNKAAVDILSNIDLFKLKDWLRHRLSIMMDQPYYKY